MARSERVILARGNSKTLGSVRQQFKRGRWTHVYQQVGHDVHVGEVLTDTLQVRKERLTARVEWQELVLYALPPQDEAEAVQLGLEQTLAEVAARHDDEGPHEDAVPASEGVRDGEGF
jgi:hypothetical protein